MAVIITGASSGIGRACAKRISFGHDLVLVGRNLSTLEKTKSSIAGAQNWHALVAGDVRNPETAAKAVAAAIELGGPTALVYCAGIGGSAKTEDADFDTNWDKIFDTNVNGAFHFVKACLPHMLENGGGEIVLMSSVAGIQGIKRNAAYTASKHALVGLAKSLAREHGKRGIVAVPVCPTFVDTPMTDKAVAGLARHRGLSEVEARELIQSQIPQGKIIPATEIAEMVAFILRGTCPSLSGHELVMSGGGL